MKKLRIISVIALLIFIGDCESWGVTIGFNPAVQNTMPGSIVHVDLYISDLGSETAPSLGVFDLDIAYDSAILSFGGVSFGDPDLGDQLDLQDLGPPYYESSPTLTGMNLYGLSFDSAAVLDALQAESFTLARLEFNTLSAGLSSLDLTINALGDSLGNPLDADVLAGNINVVPAPPAILLFGFGLAGLAGGRFYHRARRGP